MENVTTFNFSSVVLGTRIDLALVGQAALEGFLSPGADEGLTKIGRKIRNKQEALALLVLFDKVILPDFSGGNYEIPILERDGVVQVHREEHLLTQDFEDCGWYRKRDPNAFIRALDRTVHVRPLVLEYLSRLKFEFVDLLAKSFSRSRKEIINSLIDFAHSHYLGDKIRLKSNFIVEALPPDLVKMFRKDLNSQPERDGLNPIDTILFGAAHAGALLQHYTQLSDLLGVGVATNSFSGRGSLWNKHPEIQAPVEGVTEAFHLVRAALHEEGICFPRIEGIKHALKLRSDPNLKAFREQLALFQISLIRGDGSDLYRLVKEVHKSSEALKRNIVVQRSMKWLTYASIPASVLETLLHGLPIASFSLSIFSVGLTRYSERVENSHRWVMFG